MAETLVVFDLDGTLVRSVSLDAECFERAFGKAFGLGPFDDDWDRFEHVTDEGISREVLGAAFGEQGLAEKVERHRRCFMTELRQALADDGQPVSEIPGARALLAALRERASWFCAVATGGWAESARLKLDCAGIDLSPFPLATSDDAVAREDILRTAVTRARDLHGVDFERTIAVGDAVWDVRTAAGLGLPFVGVCADSYSSGLADAGAQTVLVDYRDLEGTLAALDTAVVPVRRG